MTTTGITARAWNGVAIQRRHADGFINATAMCKANGKRWNHYSSNERTREYICALAASLGTQIPCAAAVAGFPATGIQGLIDVIQCGSPTHQGTSAGRPNPSSVAMAQAASAMPAIIRPMRRSSA